MKTAARKGGSSQDRRRDRRAAERDALVATSDPALDVEAPADPDPGEALGAEMAAQFAALGDRVRDAGLSGYARSDRSRRRAVAESLVAAGEPVSTPLQTTYDMSMGGLADRFFVSAVLNAGYVDVGGDAWPVEATDLGDLDHVVFRDGSSAAVLRLPDGTLATVSVGFGWLRARIAAPSAARIAEVCSAFRSRFPASYISTSDDGRVPITFWMNTGHGPVPHLRRIESASWDAIEANYSAGVRDELGSLMAWGGPEREGQLFLWQGPPGTGKTWALRALASEWAPWAEFHYITDPDAFFVRDPSYMVNVLLSDSYEALSDDGDVVTEDGGGKWRVLILEDTGELLAADAKESYGQGLSRLLNVVDGMIGQGLRVLALVTTNDELGDLHPAAVRPGRCASQLEFGPLSRDEAQAWLDAHPADDGSKVGLEADFAGATLAELYAIASEGGADAFADDEPDSDEDEAAPGMPCAACDHTYSMHPDGGACAMDDCSCSGFKMSEEAEAAAEPVTASVELRLLPGARERFAERYLRTLEEGGDASTLTFALTDFEIVPGAEADVAAPATAAGGGIRWRAVLCPEGTPTDDGRIFAPGSISWRELPLTLMGLIKTSALGGHDQAELAGRIDNVWRDGSLIRAEGVFDAGEFGQQVAELVGDGDLRGVSVDLAVSRYEMMYRSDVLDADGVWVGGEEPGESEVDPWDVMDGDAADLMLVVWEAKIGMATVCPFQAFEPATIEVAASLAAGGAPNPMLWRFSHDADWMTSARAARVAEAYVRVRPSVEALVESVVVASGHGVRMIGGGGSGGSGGATPPPPGTGLLLVPDALVASASEAPVSPPAAWFADPALDGPTPLRIDDDGRIYGHAAVWESCHMSYADVCVAPPASATGYAYFHLGEVECADGELVPAGKITMDTGHALRTLGRTATVRHYDDTGTVVAHVRVGEDDHGIWVAGALVPGLEPEKVRTLRGSSLSGDWRDADGLELVALLAVNVPGFPVPRPRALVAASEEGRRVIALTAAGVVVADGTEQTVSPRLREQFSALRAVAAGRWDDLRSRAGA